MATSFQMLEHEMRDRIAAKNAEIDRLRSELANARLERDNIGSLNSSLIAELAEARRALLAGNDTVLANKKLQEDNAAKDRIIANLNERSAQYERDSSAKDARIAALSTVLNRIANGTRFTSDETLLAIHKVTTEILGEAYEPFDVKMP